MSPRCCATGGRRSVRVTAASSSSTATPASARPASSANWPAPWRARARSSCGAAVTRSRWRRSSPSPRRSAGTSTPSRPTGSRACPTGSSPSSPASSSVCGNTPHLRRRPGRPREQPLPVLRGGDRDPERALGQRDPPAGRRRPSLGRPAHPAAACVTCCGTSTGPSSASSGCTSTPRSRPGHRLRPSAGRSAVRPLGRDGAPAGPERRRRRGTGARAGRRCPWTWSRGSSS